MTQLQTFWNNKRVLITGHTGFKGGWLSLWLQSLGAKVCGLALEPSSTPSLFMAANVGQGMCSHIGDIRNADLVYRLMDEFKPEVIFHLAAQSLVRYSYENPVETYSTNVMGLINLLEAVRQVCTVQVVVNITSDKCYENREQLRAYRETDPMGGFDPYSSSKGCAELVSSTYRRSYLAPAGVGFATARAGNVIGGGDWSSDRLVPDILKALDGGHPVNVRNPQAIRPWQHVLDPLNGYLVLAEALWFDRVKYAGGWNFGPQDGGSQSVAWLVDRISQQWGGSTSWVHDTNDQPHEATLLRLDISKARKYLRWKPQWGLGLALTKTIEWHKEWRMAGDCRELVLRQINEYMSGAATL